MESNITINIVEPGSTPIEPVVPNTGLFTHGIGGPEATILGITAAVIILAVIVAVLYYRKKQGKFISLKHKKATAIGFASLAAVVSLGTVAGLLKLGASAADDGLTVTALSEELTIELADEPIFAVLPVELTVEEATQAGYTLTVYTDSTDLVSTTDGSKTIPMIAVEGDKLEALTDNTYGLALAEPASQAEEVYTTLSTDADTPTFITDKDHKATEADDTTTIYYGFYITPDVPYGTYTGTNINYNVEPHYITNLSFNGNGNDGGETIEGMTIIAGDTITLPENTYTKEGYNFIGWNTVAEPTEQDPGEAYADQADFTAELGETKDVTLYAQWEEATLYMQDVAKWGSKLEIGDEIIAVDNRDNKEYYVARLADGNIWMTQNLDLDLISDPTAEGYVALTPDNTNIKANWTPDNSTIDISNGLFPGWEDNNNVPYSADPGDVYYYTTGDNTNERAIDKETCEGDHEDGSCPHYHAGNYYNWSAAVASNDTSSMDTNYKNAQDSICPAGWELPDGPQESSDLFKNNTFNELLVGYDGTIIGERPSYCGGLCPFYNYSDGGFNAIRTNPLWLVRSGFVNDGSLTNNGYYGYYWSSTVSDSSSAYRLNFGSGNVYPAYNDGRNLGYSVRCIAQ